MVCLPSAASRLSPHQGPALLAGCIAIACLCCVSTISAAPATALCDSYVCLMSDRHNHDELMPQPRNPVAVSDRWAIGHDDNFNRRLEHGLGFGYRCCQSGGEIRKTAVLQACGTRNSLLPGKHGAPVAWSRRGIVCTKKGREALLLHGTSTSESCTRANHTPYFLPFRTLLNSSKPSHRIAR